ncbi:Omega-6 fatty acid desaturase, endoplasmic reticulum [Tolypocladium paradoxum]|uniref:Omega-6 fatty acid desaturase, endoplasmic reticulum n=1 Tax=Tolypocladium paradoxum TaxID=94208 RepID=A0A2S4L0P3_9HYPO|nr:Omega-6 fatty acid desaturase, endoplasmic reticulum [Tolypocladium paradoxum]
MAASKPVMTTTTAGDCRHVPETHHFEVVPAGYIEGDVGIGQLRRAIPSHCFRPSTVRSMWFFLRDILFMVTPLAATIYLERRIDNRLAKLILRAGVYPFVVGIPATGFWVLGHEAGHGSFSQNRIVGDLFGFIAHSFLLSPFFSWRSTHARHHVYANHLSKDHNYVPPQKHEYAELFQGKVDIHEATEDAPVVLLLRVILQQVIGWPWYLLTNITAAPQAVVRPSKGWWSNSHFDPWGSLFRADEFWSIVASDVGLMGMGYMIYRAAGLYGWWAVTWGYFLPLMWVNHYIGGWPGTDIQNSTVVMLTFSPESWTFLRGALSTVDRDPGFLLRHLMHHIVDLHVVHHLFPRIPHYHAQEATDAIRPLLGKYYRQDSGPWYGALYSNFRDCQWVEPNPTATEKGRVPKVRLFICRRLLADPILPLSSRLILLVLSQRHLKDDETTQGDEAGIFWYRPGRMPRPAMIMRS